MIKHVVFMKLKPGVTDAQVDGLRKGLSALPEKIPEIKEYSFGRDVVRSERSMDFALVSAFADLEALKRYIEHPDHQAVVSLVRDLSEKTLTVDFVF
ncbi:MAG: Dabb family protein [Thermodesulfobacteriota bacterium]